MCRLLLLFALLSFSAGARAAQSLTVAVAANLQYTFVDLAQRFTAQSGIALSPVYNSSGKFAAQIQNGAPFDVFLSADTEYPAALAASGHAAGAPRIYAYGQLVLWSRQPGFDMKNWQQSLLSPAVGKIAVANPKVAPYGRESMKVLARLKLDDALRAKLVFGESIAQTNQYIHSRAADAGFTAKSVVLSRQMAGQGQWVEIDRKLYQPIGQAMLITRHGAAGQGKAAQAFADFMAGPEARRILQQHGYLLP